VAQGSDGFVDRATGWALLLAPLNQTLRLLAKVHQARGELHQAGRTHAATGVPQKVTKAVTRGPEKGEPRRSARAGTATHPPGIGRPQSGQVVVAHDDNQDVAGH